MKGLVVNETQRAVMAINAAVTQCGGNMELSVDATVAAVLELAAEIT